MVERKTRGGPGVNTKRVAFTYEDYKQLPDDGYRYEILDGDMVREPAPRPAHQMISGNLFAILRQFALEHRMGLVFNAPVDVVLSQVNVLEPDLIFISRDEMAVLTEENVAGAPTLVAEILSPSTRQRDRTIKRKIYERFGVKEYWIVDPDDRTIEVLALMETGYVSRGVFTAGETLSSPVLPGLVIDVAAVFRNPLAYF